ncbi:MAG: ZIP family metal transporter [Candidatus Geothermarchaeales archaeon]
MVNVFVYTLGSVFIVSSISLIGVLTFSMKEDVLKNILLYLVSFSAGGLMGDAFIHLLPEVVEQVGFELNISLYILFGIIFFFIVEKLIHWRHCHIPISEDHPHPFVHMNLLGDAVHNFIDGLIIGGSYLVNTPLGIATTLAIVFHEIPQEIGDFGVLLHGGFSRSRALLFNFLCAVTAIVGTIVALFLSSYIKDFSMLLIPFAVGGFIYVAGSDLIPELHKERKPLKSALQLGTFILGILIMLALTLLE